MPRFFALFVLLAIGCVAGAAERPNIVLIVADDLGYGDLACFGGTDIPTPHIDSLARDGVRFTQAYAYPTCSPTRVALMTGKYAERFGVSTALMGQDAPEFKAATTVAQLLRDRAGYATGLVGKWHLGYTDDVNPVRKGFDEFFGFRGGKVDFFTHTDTAQKGPTPEGKHDLWEGEKEIRREGYTTELFTARARQFIRDQAAKAAPAAGGGKPFFLYLAHNAPHYAKRGVWQAPEKYLKRFNAVGQTQGRDVYRAMVACLDDGVGAILDELRAQKLDRNTLVIFMSDNGAEPPGSNKPLAGWKHGYREGGVRVPWVARLPGVIPPGTVRDDVVHATDFLPTILAVAGTKPPADAKLDGKDVWPAFTGGPPVGDRTIYFSDRGVRQGKWKLLNGQLFNLAADPQETTDLAGKYPEVRDRLVTESRRWAGSVGIAHGKPRASE
jgi:arylsulfatase A